MVRNISRRGAEGLLSGFATLESRHPTDPHWYLIFTGITPNDQGQGFGSKLLATWLDRADRTGTICYLETPFPEMHAFYRRLGYEITWQGNPFAGAPTIWTMIRAHKG